ncbi:MucBP domain-containing protein [Sporolactobacillus terrae]|uniref:MucBP domain-containing protein n=1 Tax=Sporolactobacillus terrae TaxID=269673 RepID=UPI001CBB11A4|nr:MucBP domain-containing protein [Sporolactobacillus terrae]UAK18105.1 MucBP domain-containing protein [Sporolactobacillus terrae]
MEFIKKIMNVILVFILVVTMVNLFPGGRNQAFASSGTNTGYYSWKDSGGYVHTTAYIEINGKMVYCYDEDKLAPDHVTYSSGENFYDKSVNSLLYYGFGGEGYSGSGGMTDYVKTWVALSNWKSGDTGTNKPANRDSFVKSLLKHAKNQDIPTYGISFDKKEVTSNIVNNEQRSETLTATSQAGKGQGELTLYVPQNVTIHMSDGSTKTNGTQKIEQGDSFYFTAPLWYNSDYVTGDVNGWRGELAGILFIPSSGSYQPTLLPPRMIHDPIQRQGFTVHFWARQKQLTVHYIDNWTHQIMWQDQAMVTIGTEYDKSQYPNDFDRNGHFYKFNTFNGYGDQLKENMPDHDVTLDIYYDPYQHVVTDYKNKYPNYDTFEHHDDLLKVGSWFDYGPKGFNAFGNDYDPENGNHFNGNVPYNDINGLLKDVLRRTITVNYLDNRTGQKIANSDVSTVHQGDGYSRKHRTDIKKGNYSYRYVREDGSAESGTVGTNNITINYYYDVPLIKTGLKKLQVYTAPSADGLPVRVYLDKVYNYDSGIADMGSKKINVSLYQGENRLETHQYAARDLPEYLTFNVPSGSGLAKNTHKPYTVKFDNYNPNDFDIENNAGQLTTDGYTSTEETLNFDLNSSINHELVQKRVVMTQVTPNVTPELFYETFDFEAPPLPENRTGYGTETKVSFGYENDLGSDYQYATPVADDDFTFNASEKLQDSYLNYPTSNGQVHVPLQAKRNTYFSGNEYWKAETFIFPHVNVEQHTGNLFTDKQVADRDSRIKNKMVDGHNQFYTPIWPENQDNIPINYPVSYSTNKLGANKVTIHVDDKLHLFAYMFAWMGSPTGEQDAILLEPINADNPFPNGAPEGWTDSDIQWLKN